MRKSRVLIIDDSKLVRDHIGGILSGMGVEIETGCNGREGCQKVFVFQPDVILMDISMPVMDGISAVRFLRTNHQTKHIPIIVFTSETDRDERIRALEAGANDLISKEANETELLVRVKNLVKLKALEDEILFEKDKLSSILNDLAQAVVIINNSNRIVMVNAAARDLLSIPPELEKDLTLRSLLSTSVELGDLIERLDSDDVQEVPITIESAAAKGTFLVRFSPIYLASGDRFGKALIFRDVTQEREVEKLKATFHSMIAHDLRSPITVITGYSDLLLGGKAGPLSDVQAEFLRAMEERANAMRKLVDEFLMVSKFEGSFIALDIKDIDVNLIIRDVTKLLNLIASNKKITVHHDLGDDLPTVKGDSDKLYKVFGNLYDNALKYTPEGGHIWLRSRARGDTVRCEFSDDGIGIDEEELPLVFDRYKRMATAEKRKIMGTGLGLAIVKEIVHAHKGRVWVESRPDEGSTFFVELPLTQSAKEVTEVAESKC